MLLWTKGYFSEYEEFAEDGRSEKGAMRLSNTVDEGSARIAQRKPARVAQELRTGSHSV
jgi:hypothetical protein